jgi:hypothetical protein
MSSTCGLSLTSEQKNHKVFPINCLVSGLSSVEFKTAYIKYIKSQQWIWSCASPINKFLNQFNTKPSCPPSVFQGISLQESGFVSLSQATEAYPSHYNHLNLTTLIVFEIPNHEGPTSQAYLLNDSNPASYMGHLRRLWSSYNNKVAQNRQ